MDNLSQLDPTNLPENYAFTDGSYNIKSKVYGFGGFLVCGDQRFVLQGNGRDPEMAKSRNVSGEVLGAMEAVRKALEIGICDLVLYYDYTGIEYWATGRWKTNKTLTKEYAAFMKDAMQRMRIRFCHVKAHTGIPGNEEADRLAKEATGLVEKRTGMDETASDEIVLDGLSEEDIAASRKAEASPIDDAKTNPATDTADHYGFTRSMERIRRPGNIDSAVLIPVVERDGERCILFEVRNRHIPQGGEICFPGGRIEADETPLQTAVRETAEELMISTTQIQVINPLFELAGPGGGSVYSYLGTLSDYADSWRESEVERTFLLPLKQLREMIPRQCEGEMQTVVGEDFPFEWIPGGKNYLFRKIRRPFYFYETAYGVIWGLTGELLYRFLKICD
ncbi:MAG: NUDIX domain-containing protein [Lachnospiraceae bacterium]|nr:NUDIX domain-containing protein [Lachnospiraceae bacterium]